MEEHFFALISPFVGAWLLWKYANAENYYASFFVIAIAVSFGSMSGEKMEENKNGDSFAKYCHGNEKTGVFRCKFPTDQYEPEDRGSSGSCGKFCGE